MAQKGAETAQNAANLAQKQFEIEKNAWKAEKTALLMAWTGLVGEFEAQLAAAV